jgi:hypothetical protein
VSDFDVKIVKRENLRYLVIKEYSLQERVKETNEGVREKELSRSPGRGAGEFPFAPAILSVLRN